MNTQLEADARINYAKDLFLGKKKMRTLMKYFLLSTLLHAPMAWSIPITDTIMVDSREWAQIDLFTNLNSSDMRRACGSGECADVQLNEFDMLGWNWGGLPEIMGLFNSVASTSFFDVDSGLAQGCFDCDDSYSDALADVGFRATGGSVRIFDGFMAGNCRDLGISVCSLAYAGISINNTNIAYVGDYIGNVAVPFIGGWFYRDAPASVPAPTTITLFLIGLAGSSLIRFRRTD